MARGKKVCPDCLGETGPRTYVCSNCNHVFISKKDTTVSAQEKRTHKGIKNFDWRSLQKGDKIKVAQGPYYLKEGELIPMGYRGKFSVESIDDKGILAWGIDKSGGIAHIYMGPEYYNKETGVTKVPHKILKLKRREPVETVTKEVV
jgi:hypothetical protein